MDYARDRGERPNNQVAKRIMSEAEEIDGDRVKIKFGPEVMKYLKQLHNAIRGADHETFDSDVQHLVGYLASGNPVSINSAVYALISAGTEVDKYARKTGDTSARDAFGLAASHILGQTADAKPVTALLLPAVARSR